MLDFYIDGIQIIDNTMSITQLGALSIGIGTELPLSAYFDEVSVTATWLVDELGMFLLLSFGMVDLA